MRSVGTRAVTRGNAADLLASGLFGIWKDRTEVTENAEFVRGLRQHAADPRCHQICATARGLGFSSVRRPRHGVVGIATLGAIMAGIKETQEVIAAVSEIKKVIIEELADGFQWEDLKDAAEKLAASPKVIAAIDGAEQVLPELKDLDLMEKISLVVSLLKAVV